MELTADFARQQVSYDPETGILTRTSTAQEAGWMGQNGYRYLSLGNKKYLSHRVAWLIHFGSWPLHTIDHINGNPLDNRLINLRDVGMDVQGLNSKLSLRNTSGYKNVYWHKPTQHWLVLVFDKGKQICVGYFGDVSDAVTARDAAKAQISGFAGCRS